MLIPLEGKFFLLGINSPSCRCFAGPRTCWCRTTPFLSKLPIQSWCHHPHARSPVLEDRCPPKHLGPGDATQKMSGLKETQPMVKGKKEIWTWVVVALEFEGCVSSFPHPSSHFEIQGFQNNQQVTIRWLKSLRMNVENCNPKQPVDMTNVKWICACMCMNI